MAPALTKRKVASPLPEAQGTVLVVEDDPMVLRVAQRVLQSHGFRVICAATADEGVQAAGDVPLDALLTDSRLPGMGAAELVRRLRATRPDLAVIIMVGSGEQTSAAGLGLEPARLRHLARPFTADGLAHTVAEVVEARRGAATRR